MVAIECFSLIVFIWFISDSLRSIPSVGNSTEIIDSLRSIPSIEIIDSLRSIPSIEIIDSITTVSLKWIRYVWYHAGFIHLLLLRSNTDSSSIVTICSLPKW